MSSVPNNHQLPLIHFKGKNFVRVKRPDGRTLLVVLEAVEGTLTDNDGTQFVKVRLEEDGLLQHLEVVPPPRREPSPQRQHRVAAVPNDNSLMPLAGSADNDNILGPGVGSGSGSGAGADADADADAALDVPPAAKKGTMIHEPTGENEIGTNGNKWKRQAW